MQLLIGPARSGKTGRLLELYAAALAAAQRRGDVGRTLWIAPTRHVAQYITQTLRARSTSVLMAPQVLTFEEFAKSILQRSARIMRPVPPMLQRSLLQRLTRTLSDNGTLQHYGTIAHTSGFLDLTQSLIAELKREECWPEVLHEACDQRGLRPADRDVLAIYAQYQQALLRTNRYDQEGRFWAAFEALQEPFTPFNTGYDLVVVDGFTDFTHTQFDWLKWLGEHATELWLSLPGETGTRRSELFSKPQRVQQRLAALFAAEDSATQFAEVAVTASALPGLQHLAEHLFANPREIPRGNDATGLRLLTATGTLGEARALAEEIKTLLLRGVGPTDIVVASRTLSEMAPYLREVFTAAGIPFDCECPIPLAHHPLLRGVQTLLQLELEDWPFETLLGLLNTNWFAPTGSRWKPAAVSLVVGELRRARLAHGKTACLTLLQQALERGETSAALSFGVEGLQKFAALTNAWSRPETWAGWVDRLSTVCRQSGLVEGLTREPTTATVWSAFEELIRLAAETETLFELPPVRLTLAEFVRELTSLLNQHAAPQPAAPAQSVRILETSQVRGLDVPYLFLAGMTERSFPARGSEATLYSEAERQQLNQHGTRFVSRTEQTAAEMLLFYGVVTRATRQLTLSYPSVSLDGQPLSASPYLHAIQELFVRGAIPHLRREDFDPVPSITRALTPAEQRVAATAAVLEGEAGHFATLAMDPARLPVALSIAGAAEMARSRFQRRGFSQYEGALEHPPHRALLQQRFPREHQFSPSQLEEYAQCPFRFFARQILRLEAPEAPDAGTDHARRGELVHQALMNVHQELLSHAQPTSPEEVSAAFRDALQTLLQQESVGSKLQAALLEIEEQLLAQWAEQYGLHWDAYQNITQKKSASSPLVPHLFELSFGQPHSSDEPAEHEPLTLGHGDKKTLIRGRIDRVDVGHVAGKSVFVVLDYKTGKPPTATARELHAGRALQLVLYSLAVQRLGIVEEGAVPLPPGYWCLKEEGFHPLSIKYPQLAQGVWQLAAGWEELVERLEDLIPRLAQGIRHGEFPVYNSDHNCTAYCPYKTTCRVGQIRPLEEKLAKVWEV